MTDYDYENEYAAMSGNQIDSTFEKCYRCKEFIPQWHDDLPPYQRENMLEVSFTGGYGMFVDPLFCYYLVHLCHDCAHALCDWLGVDAQNFHMHLVDGVQEEKHERHHPNAGRA